VLNSNRSKNKKYEDYPKLLQKKMLTEAAQVVQISRNSDQAKRLMFKEKSPSSESCSEWFTISRQSEESKLKKVQMVMPKTQNRTKRLSLMKPKIRTFG